MSIPPISPKRKKPRAYRKKRYVRVAFGVSALQQGFGYGEQGVGGEGGVQFVERVAHAVFLPGKESHGLFLNAGAAVADVVVGLPGPGFVLRGGLVVTGDQAVEVLLVGHGDTVYGSCLRGDAVALGQALLGQIGGQIQLVAGLIGVGGVQLPVGQGRVAVFVLPTDRVHIGFLEGVALRQGFRQIHGEICLGKGLLNLGIASVMGALTGTFQGTDAQEVGGVGGNGQQGDGGSQGQNADGLFMSFHGFLLLI